MKMFIILDMKKNKIDHFALKIILLTGTVKTANRPTLPVAHDVLFWFKVTSDDKS